MAGVANQGGPVAASGNVAGSSASDAINVELHGQCEDKQGWAEALERAGPLEFNAKCWFYLDPFVSPNIIISSTLWLWCLCVHVSLHQASYLFIESLHAYK